VEILDCAGLETGLDCGWDVVLRLQEDEDEELLLLLKEEELLFL